MSPEPVPEHKGARTRGDWAVEAFLLAAVTLAGFVLDRYVSLTSQAMLYVLAVVVASYRLSWVPSFACAFAAVILLNFFFVPPRWTFEVEAQEHLIALYDGRGRNETPMWLPEQRTIVFADALTERSGQLVVWGTPWHEKRVLPALRELLDLPFEHVIISHGEPVHDRAAFERALELPPYMGEIEGISQPG